MDISRPQYDAPARADTIQTCRSHDWKWKQQADKSAYFLAGPPGGLDGLPLFTCCTGTPDKRYACVIHSASALRRGSMSKTTVNSGWSYSVQPTGPRTLSGGHLRQRVQRDAGRRRRVNDVGRGAVLPAQQRLQPPAVHEVPHVPHEEVWFLDALQAGPL
ncbi:MAG: hypothetical protein JWR37_5242 [Mycobacterium sp.]|nr:hypothetical protein [Mycobacterium sp.]